MIRYLSLFLLTILCSNHLLLAQDSSLFSESNSAKYASFLVSSGQFGEAALEYERLFLIDENPKYLNQALKAYFTNGDYRVLINRLHQVEPNIYASSRLRSLLFAESLIKLNLFEDLRSFLDAAQELEQRDKELLLAFSYLFEGDIDAFKAQLTSIKGETADFLRLQEKVIKLLNQRRHRSKAVAGLLSIPVPGLGRVYTGHWKDALFSFVFVGTFVWQSLTGFSKNGIESVYGWIFGILGGAFYAGNIYGSVKSAKSFNEKEDEKIQNEILAMYHQYFP